MIFFFLQNVSIFPFLEKWASFDFLMIFRDFQNIADFNRSKLTCNTSHDIQE